MKILIVGHDGQLGTDCTLLLARKHKLLTPSLHELDLCDNQKTLNYITENTPDVVINCAAFTAVDNCENERKLCQQINAAGPGLLAEACDEIGSRLIHISTDYVFDGTKPIPQPYVENDLTNPLSHYGVTKLEGEKKIQETLENHVILRTAWLYSAHGPNFLKTMLRLTISDPDTPRRVVNDQFGSLTWSLTLAKQIETILADNIRGVVHTTSEGYSSWYEAACYFLNKMNITHNLIPCETSEYPTPAHRPLNSILENDVLKKKNMSLFIDWREDVNFFVARFRDDLLAEFRQ